MRDTFKEYKRHMPILHSLFIDWLQQENLIVKVLAEMLDKYPAKCNGLPWLMQKTDDFLWENDTEGSMRANNYASDFDCITLEQEHAWEDFEFKFREGVAFAMTVNATQDFNEGLKEFYNEAVTPPSKLQVLTDLLEARQKTEPVREAAKNHEECSSDPWTFLYNYFGL